MKEKNPDNLDIHNDDIYRIIFKEYPDVMNIKQVSEILTLSTKSVYKLINDNKLMSIKVGREYRIPKVSLMSYLGILKSD